MPDNKAKEQIARINNAFPDAMVNNYEQLVESLALSDKKDCHVLAAAIKSRANLIITNNVKHFDNKYLSNFGLAAKSADDFVTSMIVSDSRLAREAFITMVRNRTNPRLDEHEMLAILRKRGLVNSSDFLQSLI